MNTKLTIFSMMLLALFSCKEAKENIDQTTDYATGKTQIEKKIQMENMELFHKAKEMCG